MSHWSESEIRTANFKHFSQAQILRRTAPFTGINTKQRREEGEWQKSGPVSTCVVLLSLDAFGGIDKATYMTVKIVKIIKERD